MNCSNFNAEASLCAPGRAPVTSSPEDPRPAPLRDAAALSAARPSALPWNRAGELGARLNRRYLRIRAVQDALGKLNFNKAKPGTALDDFVFAQTDFSMYKKIAAGDFSLFDAGLDDFDDDFFAKSFGVGREKTAAIIGSAYKRIGAFYYLTRESHLHNPLLMAVMRTLHTSIAFRPIVEGEELPAGFAAPGGGPSAGGVQNGAAEEESFFLLKLLDGSAVSHDDGMVTTLAFGGPAGAGTAFAGGGRSPALWGTFHPRGKAYTMRLI